MSVFEELATQLSCSCPVCLEKYDITQKCPLIIPCGHTVCQQCVVGLRYHFGEGDGPMKACPVCRTPFTINPRDRKTFGLPMNTQLYLVAEKMLEASKVKPGKLEVKCRDCHQKITVDSCVKCECFANVESGPEKDLLNRDTSKLLCNDCVNRSHKEHNYQTFLEVKNQFKTREIASNLIESSKYKPKIREAAMKLRGTIEKLERLHTSHEICETALKNIAESPFLLEKGAEYIKEFKQMEKTVEEIVKETEKHCEILDRKRQFIQEVFGHVQRGGEPNAKWISERSASAVRLAYPPGLYPPSAVPQFPNRGMGQGYPVQFPIGNHYGMVQFYGFPGPGAPMVPPGIPMWHQGQRQRAQEPPRGPEELPRQVPVLQQEGVRQEVAPQQADQNQDLEIQQEPPRQGPAPQQEVLRQGAPQLAPNNQNQPLQIPQEPLGQGPEHQPPAVHAPVPQYGVPVDVQNMPLQFLIENRYRMRPVYGFPRRGAPMVPPGLQLFPQGQWQRAQEPPRGPGAQQEAPQLAPLNQDLEIRQEPPRQDPGPLVGPQNQNQPLGIPQEPLGQAPEPQQGPAPAAQDEVQDGRNNLIMDIDRMIDQVERENAPIGDYYRMDPVYRPRAPMDRMRLHRQRQRAQRGPEELLRRFPAYQRRIARRQAAMLAVQDDDMEIQELLGQNPVPLQEAPRQDGAPQLAPNNQNQALQIPPLGQGPEPQRGPLAIYEPVVQDGRQRVDLPLIIAPINEPPPIEAFRRVRPNLGLPIHGAPRRPQEERLRPQEPPRGVQQEAPRPPVGPQNQNQLREFLQELLGPDPNNQQVPDRNGQAFFLERIRVIVERTALRVFEEQLQRFQEHVQHRLRRPARRVQRPQRPRQRSEPPMGRPEPQQEAQWPLARGPRRPRRPQRHDPIGVPGRIRPAQEDRRD